MKKFFLKSLLFALAALFAVQMAGLAFSAAAIKNREEKILWAFSKKNRTYDCAFLGSSRVLNMVDISLIEKERGKPSINLGNGGSGLADNYLTLYGFFKNGNSAKNLFVQLDEQSLDPDKGFGHPFHEYLFFRWLGEKEVDAVYLDEVGYGKYLYWKYLPFLRYVEFNNPFKKIALGLILKKVDYDKSGGSELLEGAKINSETEDDRPKEWAVDAEAAAYLDKIVSLAKGNGSEIFFYTAPYPKAVIANRDISEINNFIRAESARNEIPYLDFRDSKLSGETKLFRNLDHLNRQGAEIFTADLLEAARKKLK